MMPRGLRNTRQPPEILFIHRSTPHKKLEHGMISLSKVINEFNFFGGEPSLHRTVVGIDTPHVYHSLKIRRLLVL